VGASALAFGQSRTLPPKDGSGRDPGFAAFFTQLRETVRTKDAATLLRVVNPNIKNSFGGDDGVEEFRGIWAIDKPDSKIWGTLDRILKLGGSWLGQETYCAPHLFVEFPEDLDAFEHLVVTGTRVRLRVGASLGAPVRLGLSYTIVR
jgi:hypothetical protein